MFISQAQSSPQNLRPVDLEPPIPHLLLDILYGDLKRNTAKIKLKTFIPNLDFLLYSTPQGVAPLSIQLQKLETWVSSLVLTFPPAYV